MTLYLKTDKITIKLGSITIRSHPLTPNGAEYILDQTAITGWTDTTDMKRPDVIRPISFGSFSDNGLFSARNISISGIARSTTPVELHQMRDTLTGILNNGEYDVISVEDASGTRYANIGLAKTSWIQNNDISAVWKIDLYAPDPRIYSAARTVTLSGLPVVGGLKAPITYPINFNVPVTLQSKFLINNGNSDSWPIFNVVGDYHTGFSITDNIGNLITYTGPVSTADPVVIDSLRGVATQGGADRSTFLSKRGWFSIPPNGRSIRPSFIPDMAINGWCDIIYKDTWI